MERITLAEPPESRDLPAFAGGDGKQGVPQPSVLLFWRYSAHALHLQKDLHVQAGLSQPKVQELGSGWF